MLPVPGRFHSTRDRRRTHIAALALAGACLLGTTAAFAQSNNAAARRAFQRGVSALNEGRFADAVTALEESERLQHAPIVLYDLGLSYRALGRYRDAADAFERYAAAPERNADAHRLATVRIEIDRLRGALARVTFHVQPPEATLQIDGRPQTPEGGSIVLDPGSHVFEFNADGYRGFRREMNLQAGSQSEIQAQLEPTAWAARIQVDASSLATASIYIDDQFVGRGHAERHMPSGDHRIEIHAPGYDVYRRTVHVGVDGVVRVDAHLDREGHNRWIIPVAAGGGALVVAAIVIGVVVAANAPDPPYPSTWGNVQAITAR